MPTVTPGSSNEVLAANSKRFCKFTAPNDISKVDEFWAYLDREGAGEDYQVRAAIYTDAAGSPDALVAASDMQLHQSIAKDDPQWYFLKYPANAKPVLTAGVDYWLGVQVAKAIKTYYDAGDAGQEKEGADAYAGGIADPFGAITDTHAHSMSVFVTYTTVEAGRFDDLLPDADNAAEDQRSLPTIAMTVWGEARGASMKTKTGVAWVIKNRALLALFLRPDFSQVDLEDEMARQVKRAPAGAYAFNVWDSVTPDPNYAKLTTPLSNGTVWEWESSAAAAYHVAKYPIPVGKRPTEGGHEYSDPTFGSHFFYTPGSIPQAIAAVTQKMVVLDGLEFYRYKVWNEYFED